MLQNLECKKNHLLEHLGFKRPEADEPSWWECIWASNVMQTLIFTIPTIILCVIMYFVNPAHYFSISIHMAWIMVPGLVIFMLLVVLYYDSLTKFRETWLHAKLMVNSIVQAAIFLNWVVNKEKLEEPKPEPKPEYQPIPVPETKTGETTIDFNVENYIPSGKPRKIGTYNETKFDQTVLQNPQANNCYTRAQLVLMELLQFLHATIREGTHTTYISEIFQKKDCNYGENTHIYMLNHLGHCMHKMEEKNAIGISHKMQFMEHINKYSVEMAHLKNCMGGYPYPVKELVWLCTFFFCLAFTLLCCVWVIPLPYGLPMATVMSVIVVFLMTSLSWNSLHIKRMLDRSGIRTSVFSIKNEILEMKNIIKKIFDSTYTF